MENDLVGTPFTVHQLTDVARDLRSSKAAMYIRIKDDFIPVREARIVTFNGHQPDGVVIELWDDGTGRYY